MNKIPPSEQYGIMLIVAVPLNFLIATILQDASPADQMLGSTFYFSFFSLLLVFFNHRYWISNKKPYLFLLMLIFPCLYLRELHMGVNPYDSSVHGYKLQISSWLIGVPNLVISSSQAASGSLIGCQSYSLVMAMGLIAILWNSRKNNSNIYYKIAYWIFIMAACVLGYKLIAHITVIQLIGSFLGKYLIAYSLLWVAYGLLHRYVATPIRFLLTCILALLFPAISILPGQVNTITADMYPLYTGAIGITPLTLALPFTLKQLIMDMSQQEQLWPFSVKLYTLLQACIVFLALPSVLLSKTQKND